MNATWPRPDLIAALAAVSPPLLGVLTDVDGTLTSDGRMPPEAFDALWALARAGLRIIPVTGRSAGWAHMMMHTWPVDAVVAESGGLWYVREPGPGLPTPAAPGRLTLCLHDEPARIAADRRALQACAARVLGAVPDLAEADDNRFRQVDLALDHCESVPAVAPEAIGQALAMFQAEGFSARASSVHINAWRGDFDKAPSTLRCLIDAYGNGSLSDPARWVFIGDAPNDASMFSAFAHTVGVANLRPHLDQLPRPPGLLTEAEGGAGFAEFARALLAAVSPGQGEPAMGAVASGRD